MNKQIEDKFKDQDKYIGNLCDKITRAESNICKIEKHLDMYLELEPKDSSVLFITNSELSPKIKTIFTQQSNHLQEKNEKIERLKEQLTNQINDNKILRIRLENYKPIVIYKDAAAGIEKVTKDKNAKIEELEYDNHSYKNRIQKCCDENLNLKSEIKELKRINKSQEKDRAIQCETIRNLRESIQNLEANGCCILSQKIPASTLAEKTEFTRNGIDFITLPKGRFEQMQSRENLYLDIERSIKGE